MVLLILGGVAAVLALNLNLKGTSSRGAISPEGPSGAVSSPTGQASASAPGTRRPAGFREYPLGDEVERDQVRIAGVWLPPVQVEGMPGPTSPAMIHIEADIHATEGNKNGSPKDEFIPYLRVHYAIVPQGEAVKSLEPLRGELMPMVARDGWHYGASVPMPRAGRFKLTYTIEPPSTA